MASVTKEHHIVSGLALTIMGIVGIIGSLTGSLGAMLDALFLTTNGVNKDLTAAPGSNNTPTLTPFGLTTPGLTQEGLPPIKLPPGTVLPKGLIPSTGTG